MPAGIIPSSSDNNISQRIGKTVAVKATSGKRLFALKRNRYPSLSRIAVYLQFTNMLQKTDMFLLIQIMFDSPSIRFNNTCYDSFDENMTLILDDYRKLMFYDFETGILYERTAEGIWYKRVKCSSIPYEVAHKPILLSHRKDGDFYEKYKDIHSTGRTVEKLSKKPKLSRPTYITERHFIKTTTE